MSSVASRGPGRGKIRPPRRGLNGHDSDFETSWAVLERAFGEIHTKNASALSFEELYRNAYKLVLNKKGEHLYNKVVLFEREWLGEHVRSSIVQLLTPALLVGGANAKGLATPAEQRVAGEVFLRALKQAWEDHQVCMGMLTDVLMYMDRVYCTDHRQPSIFAKSMGIFRDQILRTPARPEMSDLLTILTTTILDQIQMDRDGEKIDQYLIKSNVYMLEGLYESEQEAEDDKLYLTSFEHDFLESSAEYYREEGERLLADSDAAAYCRHAKQRIQEESDRCRSTLSETTAPKLERVVEDELIRNKVKSLIEMDSGVTYMIDNDQIQGLSDIYDLEGRVDVKKTELTRAINKIILEKGKSVNSAALAPQPQAAAEEAEDGEKKAGKAINQQTSAALKWVEDILSLKERFDKIWRQAFNSDQGIHMALNRSMSEVINDFLRPAEYISLFIDENMKKGIRNKSEAEIDETLDKAITLLRFLQDKDIFETYYKKHLCKRLLLNKSQSIDVEKQMISRMKIELGNNFTQKLEAMFKDMTISEEYSNGYREYVAKLGDADPKRIDMNVHILTTMTWPADAFRSGSGEEGADRTQIIYPASIDHVRQGFERFYAEKHSGRKLTWQGHMGEAVMKATFPGDSKDGPRTYEIRCTTYTMLILLLFNDVPAGQTITTEEIQAQTNIPEGDLHRQLQTLAVAAKTRFLLKQPMSRDIKPTDQFSFNQKFKSQFLKIKVNLVAGGNKVEGERERKETEQKTDADRRHYIEAAVVRIMKQRKELTHTALINETITQLASQFKPDVNMIKKRIESLLEREYLERIEEAAVPSYRYLA